MRNGPSGPFSCINHLSHFVVKIPVDVVIQLSYDGYTLIVGFTHVVTKLRREKIPDSLPGIFFHFPKLIWL